MSNLVSDVYSREFLDEALKLDPNIRLVAIYDGLFRAKFREGIKRNFEDEEIKSSLSEAQDRWDSRKKSNSKIDEPKFAMAQYGTVNRIIISSEDDGIILMTTELDVDVNKLVDKVIETRIRFLD
ncbi:MAG: hypothetical protein ACO2Y5_07915 [Nitrosopumilaceae archaeon]